MKRFITVLFILVCAANIAFCQKPAFKKPGKCNDVELQKLNGNVKTIVQQFWTQAKKVNGELIHAGEPELKITAFSKNGFIEYVEVEFGIKIVYTYDIDSRHRPALTKTVNNEERSRTVYLGAGTDTLIEMITIPGEKIKSTLICEPTINTRSTTTITVDEPIKMTVDERTYERDVIKCKYTTVSDHETKIRNSTITTLKRDGAGNPTKIVTEHDNGTLIYEEVKYTYY